MKKVITAILAILYISTATGITIHMHYCMGKLADWGLWQSKTTTCSKCGMTKNEEKDSGCCKDVHKQIKLDKDHKTSESGWRMIQLLPVALPVSFSEISFNDFPSVTEENPFSHAPPRSSGIAVYIRNCVFLI